MKKLFVAVVLSGVLCAVVEIPKSSLEQVKMDTIKQLEAAQKAKNAGLVAKYQAELGKIEKKIQKFEREWLEYRRQQLKAKPTATSMAEIAEIDKLLQARP